MASPGSATRSTCSTEQRNCSRVRPTAPSRRSGRASGASIWRNRWMQVFSEPGSSGGRLARSAAGGEARECPASRARRIRRPAGPLVDRYADVLVAHPRRGRRALARPDPRCADGAQRLRGDLRALRRRSAQARRARATGRIRARQPQCRALPDHRIWAQLPRRRRAGPETGFFLDQRENRQRVRSLAAGRDVLDGFCYTGGSRSPPSPAARSVSRRSKAPRLRSKWPGRTSPPIPWMLRG